MMKILAAAIVVVLFVGSALTAANLQGRREASRQGLMPEVTVTAEMPRLVMPTVEVHAVRMVAMSGSDLNIY
jgi:cytochrome c556